MPLTSASKSSSSGKYTAQCEIYYILFAIRCRGATCLGCIIFACLCIPETKGLSLEQVCFTLSPGNVSIFMLYCDRSISCIATPTSSTPIPSARRWLRRAAHSLSRRNRVEDRSRSTRGWTRRRRTGRGLLGFKFDTFQVPNQKDHFILFHLYRFVIIFSCLVTTTPRHKELFSNLWGRLSVWSQIASQIRHNG